MIARLEWWCSGVFRLCCSFASGEAVSASVLSAAAVEQFCALQPFSKVFSVVVVVAAAAAASSVVEEDEEEVCVIQSLHLRSWHV